MPRRRLPPLNAVRAFEAAARHLNFDRAGDELVVTASAVGQQVRALEEWLGQPLFTRLPSKGVVLTPIGERYAASLSQMLDELHEATARALRPETSRVVTISALPSFCANWLIPRLGLLRAKHPDLDVRVAMSLGMTDFVRDGVDMVVRFGRGVWPGLRSDLLLEETFFPVCSAALLDDSDRPLGTAEDLRHHTLIHEVVEAIPDYITWERWLAAVGVIGVDTSRGPRFQHTFLSLQAAASGQGVALATNVLIGDYLDAGRLVRPFPQEVKGTYQYYVACPAAWADRPAIVTLREWLLSEARSQGVTLGGSSAAPPL